MLKKIYKKIRSSKFLTGISIFVILILVLAAVPSKEDSRELSATADIAGRADTSANTVEETTAEVITTQADEITSEIIITQAAVDEISETENTIEMAAENDVVSLEADAIEAAPIDRNMPQQPEEAITEIPVKQDIGDTIVYITESGNRYHRDGCQHLRQSKKETTLSQAIADNKTPCGTCNPPTP